MPYNGERLRGRFVDLVHGVKAFAYGCGKSACDDKTFQSRFIEVRPDGRKVFAFAGECHEQPQDAGAVVNFVRMDLWPPFGLTDVVLFKFISLQGYPQTLHCLGDLTDACPAIYLHWDGGHKWTGSYTASAGALTVTLEQSATPDPGHPGRFLWQVTFGGCMTPTVITLFTDCIYPTNLGGQGFTIGTDCCPTEVTIPPDVACIVQGFTNRAVAARLEGTKRVVSAAHPQVRKMFAASHCCEADTSCNTVVCCGCPAYPYQWSFSMAGATGAAACANGDWIVTLAVTDPVTGHCTWWSDGGTCAPAPFVAWHFGCTGGEIQLSFEFGGCAATYSISLADFNCLGPNLLKLESVGGSCTGWPLTITITPV